MIAPFVTESATLLSIDSAIPPNDSKEWLEQTARQIKQMYSTGQGGLLVLCTSYAKIEGLSLLLASTFGDLLITQKASFGAQACAQRFIQLGKGGDRPVWLGVGSAWTGIDIADKSVGPEQDLLLTDLFIPRLPSGFNRSLTHSSRVKKLGFMAEVHETLRHFRQGVGRLVRREGLQFRRMCIAYCRAQNKKNHHMAGFRNMLKPYKIEQMPESKVAVMEANLADH